MLAGLRLLQPKSPEWLHSGRYLLIALALHVLVLFYPLTPNVDESEATPPSPIQVQLTERLAAVPPKPPTTPEKVAAPKPVHPEKPALATRPVIAMAPDQAAAPPAFSVPAPAVAPPVAQSAPEPAPSPVAPATYSAPVFNAAYLQNPKPAYPSLSRRLGEEGKVLLKVRVTPDGRAATVDIEKSSDSERFDHAAREAVKHWRFIPAKRGDEPIEATVIVPIVFRLDN